MRVFNTIVYFQDVCITPTDYAHKWAAPQSLVSKYIDMLREMLFYKVITLRMILFLE